jgi:HEAT repeat protein
MIHITRRLATLVVLGAIISRPAYSQSLAQRIASAPEGRVQFNYASREAACGDGRSYVRINWAPNSNDFYGSYNSDAGTMPACVHGPVRIVLEQAARVVVGIRVFVGPLGPADGATDLGAVRPREAADYLLSLAATAEGSVSRDAIMPAMLADSVSNQQALLAIARDQTRARETRRNAISWLGRDATIATAAQPLAQPLLAIATDENDNQQVRQQALRTLARLEGGSGIPQLIALAGDPHGGWVAREALASIAQSGDPRARNYLRDVVRKAELPDETLAVAIRSFGQQFATATDVQLIRSAWPKLTGAKAQEAAIAAVTEFGGAENARWLLTLARDQSASINIRRRALQDASRAGAKTADLVGVYDQTTDPQTKDAVISALSQIGDQAATDKLLAIAKSDESLTARRRAISALSRSTDPRVKKELEAMVEKGSGR